jgi:ATP-binding cassette subfamily B protein
LLVLDEASANLDEGTEADIALSIRELTGKTTVVVVSHRKGLLAYADRVIELGAAVKVDRPGES